MTNPTPVRAVSRRQILQKILSGTIVGVATQAGIGLAIPQGSYAQRGLSPEGALRQLIAGNQRMVANQPTSIAHDLVVLREHTIDKQEPFAGVLACADSRVPVELVFDQTIGHIFVTRVAGNMVTPEVIATSNMESRSLGSKCFSCLAIVDVEQ